MCFSESYTAVNEKRIITLARIFCDCERSGMSKVIIFADDKGIEGIAGIQLCIGQNLLTYRFHAIAGRRFFFGAVKRQAAG